MKVGQLYLVAPIMLDSLLLLLLLLIETIKRKYLRISRRRRWRRKRERVKYDDDKENKIKIQADNVTLVSRQMTTMMAAVRIKGVNISKGDRNLYSPLALIRKGGFCYSHRRPLNIFHTIIVTIIIIIIVIVIIKQNIQYIHI